MRLIKKSGHGKIAARIFIKRSRIQLKSLAAFRKNRRYTASKNLNFTPDPFNQIFRATLNGEKNTQRQATTFKHEASVKNDCEIVIPFLNLCRTINNFRKKIGMIHIPLNRRNMHKSTVIVTPDAIDTQRRQCPLLVTHITPCHHYFCKGTGINHGGNSSTTGKMNEFIASWHL